MNVHKHKHQQKYTCCLTGGTVGSSALIFLAMIVQHKSSIVHHRQPLSISGGQREGIIAYPHTLCKVCLLSAATHDDGDSRQPFLHKLLPPFATSNTKIMHHCPRSPPQQWSLKGRLKKSSPWCRSVQMLWKGANSGTWAMLIKSPHTQIHSYRSQSCLRPLQNVLFFFFCKQMGKYWHAFHMQTIHTNRFTSQRCLSAVHLCFPPSLV